MQGVRDGVAHLRSLGLVRGDLNPANFMVEGEDGVAVIVDFDSCRREGEVMGVKGPSPEWGEFTEYATRESNVRGLEQTEWYLLG